MMMMSHKRPKRHTAHVEVLRLAWVHGQLEVHVRSSHTPKVCTSDNASSAQAVETMQEHATTQALAS
jgi:hypothetical protein